MNQYEIAIASAKELERDYIIFAKKDRSTFEFENANEKLQRSLAEMDVYIKRVENNHIMIGHHNTIPIKIAHAT